jgi:hypothetical protein
MTHMKRWNDPQHPRFKRVDNGSEWPDDKEMFLIVCEEQARQEQLTKEELDDRIRWAHDPDRWPHIFNSIIMGRQHWFRVRDTFNIVDQWTELRESNDDEWSDAKARREAVKFFTNKLIGPTDVALARALANI